MNGDERSVSNCWQLPCKSSVAAKSIDEVLVLVRQGSDTAECAHVEETQNPSLSRHSRTGGQIRLPVSALPASRVFSVFCDLLINPDFAKEASLL